MGVMEKDSIAEKVSIATKPKPPSLEMCLRLDTRTQSSEYKQLPLLGCSSSLLQQYTFPFTAFSFSFLNNFQNGGSCLKDASKAIIRETGSLSIYATTDKILSKCCQFRASTARCGWLCGSKLMSTRHPDPRTEGRLIYLQIEIRIFLYSFHSH